jgi:hypothetical protein
MKKVMMLVAAIGLMAVTQNANAIALRFKFKTFSSGPNIYACNAGIRAPELRNKVCYFQDTGLACDATQACSDTQTNCNSSCVCAGTNGGQWLMNYGKADYQDWKDNDDTTATGVKAGQTFVSSGNDWAQLMGNTDAWSHRIKNLQFDLGSELYNAEYFVDICFRGPQIDYYLVDNGVSANFDIQAQVNATDFIATGVNPGENNRDGLTLSPAGIPFKYTEISGLKVKAEVICDRQGQGTYKFAHDGSTLNAGSYVFNASKIDSDFGSASKDLDAVSNEGYLKDGIANLNFSSINNWLNLYAYNAPRFCKVRYTFTETNASQNTLKVNLRKWQRHGAEMCTYTNIEEATK